MLSLKIMMPIEENTCQHAFGWGEFTHALIRRQEWTTPPTPFWFPFEDAALSSGYHIGERELFLCMDNFSFSEELIKKFWSLIDKNGPIPKHCADLGPCWKWTGKINDSGYGVIRFHWEKPAMKAHRMSFALRHGPIQKGVLICHKCDNPFCVNPEHLFAGSYLDNNRDSIKKGRRSPLLGKEPRPFGGRAGKLTVEQVIEIRRLYDEERMTQEKIGEIYGICGSAVGHIIRGKSYMLKNPTEYTPKKRGLKLNADEVAEIRRLYFTENRTQKALAADFRVSQSTISHIILRKHWVTLDSPVDKTFSNEAEKRIC